MAAAIVVGLSLALAGCGSTQSAGSSGSVGAAHTSASSPSAATSTDGVTQDLDSALSSAGHADSDANSAQQAANTPDH
jgi:hypothetical protein